MRKAPELPPRTYSDAADFIRACLHPNYALRPSVARLGSFSFLLRPPSRAAAIAAAHQGVEGEVDISGFIGGATGCAPAAGASGEGSASSESSAPPSTATGSYGSGRLDTGGPSRGPDSAESLGTLRSSCVGPVSRSDSFGLLETPASAGSGGGSVVTGATEGEAQSGGFVACLRRAWARLEGGRLYEEDSDMEAAFVASWAPTAGGRRLLGTVLLAMVSRVQMRVWEGATGWMSELF